MVESKGNWQLQLKREISWLTKMTLNRKNQNCDKTLIYFLINSNYIQSLLLTKTYLRIRNIFLCLSRIIVAENNVSMFLHILINGICKPNLSIIMQDKLFLLILPQITTLVLWLNSTLLLKIEAYDTVNLYENRMFTNKVSTINQGDSKAW